jgi:hypothetical protein
VGPPPGAARRAAGRRGGGAGGHGASDAEVTASIDERRAVFETAVAEGEEALAGLWFLIPVAMASIAVVVVVGVTARFAEYR